jgi:Ca2+-binding EF-hand superfamily protein
MDESESKMMKQVKKLVKTYWDRFDSDKQGYLDRDQTVTAVKTIIWKIENQKFQQLTLNVLLQQYGKDGIFKLLPQDLVRLIVQVCERSLPRRNLNMEEIAKVVE